MDNQKTKSKDFVEIKFTGYVDGKVFDSNIPEDLKELSPDAKPEKTIVCIGEKMVVPGLDKALENKNLNEEYRIKVPYNEGFGKKHRELIKTIPLSVFTKQKINPIPGASLLLDNQLARIITISGARVLTDFNNPLSGKDLEYKYIITRIVLDKKENSEALFKFNLKHVPQLEIKDSTLIVKGPKVLEQIVKMYSKKFKDLLDLDLEFKEELNETKPINNSNNIK
jgi:peptidylprolyl isomerase